MGLRVFVQPRVSFTHVCVTLATIDPLMTLIGSHANRGVEPDDKPSSNGWHELLIETHYLSCDGVGRK